MKASLADLFVALADSLVTDYDVVELMQRLTESCVELLDCRVAGLLLADEDDVLHAIASSDERLLPLDALEADRHGGPGYEALRRVASNGVQALDAGRWPGLAAIALPQGIRAVEVFPMRLRDTGIGALMVFFDRATGFLLEDRTTAQALADVATIGILQQREARELERTARQLRAALLNRVVIEQAKGVLAERGGLPMEGTFDVLRGYSRTRRLRVADVARAVVDRTLDPDEVLRG